MNKFILDGSVFEDGKTLYMSGFGVWLDLAKYLEELDVKCEDLVFDRLSFSRKRMSWYWRYNPNLIFYLRGTDYPITLVVYLLNDVPDFQLGFCIGISQRAWFLEIL